MDELRVVLGIIPLIPKVPHLGVQLPRLIGNIILGQSRRRAGKVDGLGRVLSLGLGRGIGRGLLAVGGRGLAVVRDVFEGHPPSLCVPRLRSTGEAELDRDYVM